MKAILILLAFLLSNFYKAQMLQWSNLIGNVSAQTGQIVPFQFATDKNGNIYSTGWFKGSVDFDPAASTYSMNSASPSCYVCKFDASGNFIWAVNIVNISGNSNGKYALTVDAFGNIFVHGFFNGTCDFNPGSPTYSLAATQQQTSFLLKLDAYSNFKWVLLPGANVTVKEVLPDGLGNLIAAGTFTGTVDFKWGAGTKTLTSVGVSDGFVNKINSGGNSVSVKQFGGSSSTCYLGRLYTAAGGQIGVCGAYTGVLNADFGASNTSYNSASLQMFAVYLDSALNYVSSFTVNPINGSSAIASYNFDNSGNLIAVGQYSGVCDFDFSTTSTSTLQSTNSACFILKLSKNGVYQWVKSLSTKLYVIDLKSDNAGRISLCGAFTGTVDADPGPAVTLLDSLNGPCLIWSVNADGLFAYAFNSASVIKTANLPDGSLVTMALEGQRLRINKYNSLYTGITNSEIMVPRVLVFPNPCKNLISIGFVKEESGMCVMRAINGNKVLNFPITKTNDAIDISELPSGCYILEIFFDNRPGYTTKIIKL